MGKFFSERSRVLYWFLVAGITKYYKFSGLKMTNLFSYGSRSQKSEMGFPGLKLGCGQGVFLPAARMGVGSQLGVPFPAVASL